MSTFFPKILIADDEKVIRDLFLTLLSREGLEILFAEDGKSCLSMAKEYQPDAILLDIMMPGMDGYEVCRKIRSISELAEIPIIMITSLDDREERLEGLRAGADDFLTKPIDMIELQIRVRNILNINRYRNLLVERLRFQWVVENDDKGYIILDDYGIIQYANQRAQIYFHLPEDYNNLNFEQQATKYYQFLYPENETGFSSHHGINYLVQPESPSARAFWLRSEELQSPHNAKKQRLLQISDVTDLMANFQDTRKFHLVVAHKLRTPVSLLYSSMNLLTTKINLLSEEEIRPMIKTAWESTERLVTEVHNILKYIDSPVALQGGHPFLLKDLPLLTNTICGSLGLDNLILEIPDELLKKKVNISKNALELIIFELFENSQKFHPNHAPQICIRVEAAGSNTLRLLFLDNGQHLTAEQILHAKQPYYQGEKYFTGEARGMGLGLPMVIAITKQAGGQVRIENRRDQMGIQVSLTLPISQQ